MAAKVALARGQREREREDKTSCHHTVVNPYIGPTGIRV